MVNEEADGYLLRVVFPQVFPCSYSLNVRAGSKGSSVKVIDGATAELIQNRLAPLDPMHEPHTVTGFASPSVSAVLHRPACEDAQGPRVGGCAALPRRVSGHGQRDEDRVPSRLPPAPAKRCGSRGRVLAGTKNVVWLADFARRWYRHKVHNIQTAHEKWLAVKPEPMKTQLFWLDADGKGHNKKHMPEGYDNYGMRKLCATCTTKIVVVKPWDAAAQDRIVFMAEEWGAAIDEEFKSERAAAQRRTFWCPTCQPRKYTKEQIERKRLDAMAIRQAKRPRFVHVAPPGPHE